MKLPSATITAPICNNTPDVNGVPGCQCSTTISGQDVHTNMELPYSTGTFTVIDECAQITSYPSTDYTATPTTLPANPYATDYTYTSDDGAVVVYPTATEYEFVEPGGQGWTNWETVPVGTPTETVATATPTANCAYWNNERLSNTYVIYGIENWTDKTAKYGVWQNLRYEIGRIDKDTGLQIADHWKTGCGAVTNWRHQDDTDYGYIVKFDPDLGNDNTCIEHAIRTAGGPLMVGDDAHGCIKIDQMHSHYSDTPAENLDTLYKNHPDKVAYPYPTK